jgi:hypothetical protein
LSGQIELASVSRQIGKRKTPAADLATGGLGKFAWLVSAPSAISMAMLIHPAFSCHQLGKVWGKFSEYVDMSTRSTELCSVSFDLHKHFHRYYGSI